jgi:hypothetical protein
MRKTLQITPIPENGDLFAALKRAGIDIDLIKKDKISIDTKDHLLVERILGIHGFKAQDQKPLLGAIEKLNEKYSKLFEVSLSRDAILRNSLGRTVSARQMAATLNKLFNARFGLGDTTPYVRSFNQALASATDEKGAENVWKRLYMELSHANKRTLPDD